jgi:hypothetical protein
MRRLFWLGVGAGLGITGYRRATRAVRELTHPFSAPRARRRLSALSALNGLPEFARDVRDGMVLYEQERRDTGQRQAPEGPTLGRHQGSAAKASRNGSPAH